MIPTGVAIDLRGVINSHRVYATWHSKTAASAALKALRFRGLNITDTISAHPASSHLFRGWVIGRPDDLAEMTLIMREDGSWARGRLWDGFEAARWEHMPLADGPIPATFSHVTRTVPHTGARTERYKAKSNGSAGRWIRSDDSVALCTCGWKAYAADRPEARGRATAHRMEVAA